MKIIFVILASFISMVLIPLNVSAATVAVGNASGMPGDTSIVVPVTISDIGSEKIPSVDLWLAYDSNLVQAVGVRKGNLTSAWSMAANTNLTGEVKIALYHTGYLAPSEGELVQIIFNVKPAARAGKNSPLHLTKINLGIAPADRIQDGTFAILGPAASARPAATRVTDSGEAATSAVPSSAQQTPFYGVAPVIVTQPAVERESPDVIPEEEPDRMTAAESIPNPQVGAPAQYVTPERPIEGTGKPVRPATTGVPFETKTNQPPIAKEPVPAGKEAIEKPDEAQLVANAKELNRFLLWRSYKLEIGEGASPLYWELAEKQKLPFWLKLNKVYGTIYGVVWAKKDVELKLKVITNTGMSKEAVCKLKIK